MMTSYAKQNIWNRYDRFLPAQTARTNEVNKMEEHGWQIQST